MRLNTKGQVTIPASLRRRYGFAAGDEVDVVDEGGSLRIVHATTAATRGERIVTRMRGRATTGHSTDELMALLRDGSAD